MFVRWPKKPLGDTGKRGYPEAKKYAFGEV
jgi:hypothetical protein